MFLCMSTLTSLLMKSDKSADDQPLSKVVGSDSEDNLLKVHLQMDTNKSQCPRVDPPQVDLTSSSADETLVHPDKQSAPSASVPASNLMKPAEVPAGPDTIPIAPLTPAVSPAHIMNSATLTADATNDYWHLQLLSPPSLINPSKISECPSLLLFPDPMIVKDSSHLPSPTVSESLPYLPSLLVYPMLIKLK